MFLQVVGHNQRYRTVQPIFRRSTEVTTRYFKAVFYVVGELRDEMIRPPSNQCHHKIQESIRFKPYFKDCVGAVDGTHVLARVPQRISTAFRGRKVGRGQLMMPLYLQVHIGKFFLVDVGYAVRPGFLPPYRGTRYHLKEYGRGNHPQNAKELFNIRHFSFQDNG